MPLKLDKVDLLILKSLLEDGRKPYRIVAREVGVSTPTVKSRVMKMLDLGIIKKFVPIIDIEKVENMAFAIILLKVEFDRLDEVVSRLNSFDEVRNIYVTSGDSNLIIRVVAQDAKSIHSFLNEHIANLDHVKITSVQIIIKTPKDEQGFVPLKDVYVGLKCDTCGQQIKEEPVVLNVGEGKRFFCCKTCLAVYKEKYLMRY